MIPVPITLGSKSGTVLYIDAEFNPVPKGEASHARVLFDDGSTAFYVISQARAAGGPNSGRYEKGSGKKNQLRPATSKDADRIKSMKLPPAWTNIQLSDDPEQDLQATGEDKKGRTQYRYTAKHNKKSAATKFSRVKAFNTKLKSLRKQIAKDLKSKDPDVQEAAVLLNLIDTTGFRPGSDRDTLADAKAHGASQLEDKHVEIDGDVVSFDFIGKKGVRIEKIVEDKVLADTLRARVEIKGKRLFSEDADRHIRKYMNEHAKGFTPKDLRTWHATAIALREVQKIPRPETAAAFKRAQQAVAKVVSEFLGNTPNVAMKSYINPSVFSSWSLRQS